MKKSLVLTVLFAVTASLAAAPATKGEWTGFITDTHCAEKGAVKDHTADCVQKCMKGGSKPQIWNEADKKLYNLVGFDKVKALMGGKVTVKGTLNPETNTIVVETATRAEATKKPN